MEDVGSPWEILDNGHLLIRGPVVTKYTVSLKLILTGIIIPIISK